MLELTLIPVLCMYVWLVVRLACLLRANLITGKHAGGIFVESLNETLNPTGCYVRVMIPFAVKLVAVFIYL